MHATRTLNNPMSIDWSAAFVAAASFCAVMAVYVVFSSL
jgi:hypothetical protein